MTDACDARIRTGNLLGALALVGAERVGGSTGAASGRPVTDTAALVALTTALGGVSQDALGRVVGLTQSGSVRLVDRLVAAGLAERRPGEDRRTHAVEVTPAGAELARAAIAARRSSLDAVLDPLDDGERRQLAGLLEKLLAGVTGSRADAHRICRLCDPPACGHDSGRCPVTRAADRAEAPG